MAFTSMQEKTGAENLARFLSSTPHVQSAVCGTYQGAYLVLWDAYARFSSDGYKAAWGITRSGDLIAVWGGWLSSGYGWEPTNFFGTLPVCTVNGLLSEHGIMIPKGV